jgi:DNA mismatch repair protein MutL
VSDRSQRIYQVFGKETLDQLIPVAAHIDLQRVGIPLPPPWRRDEGYVAPEPGELRLHGFVSKPEIQKLNKNSIFIFVNGRLIRDRLVQHALGEAYRNIMPPTSYPVVLLFLEMPTAEVDVNVHPSKVEVRFRQQAVVHDFVRDSIRAGLMKARPIPAFVQEIHASPKASTSLSPAGTATEVAMEDAFALSAPQPPAFNQRLGFDVEQAIQIDANTAIPVPRFPPVTFGGHIVAGAETCSPAIEEEPAAASYGEPPDERPLIATLKPLGQIRESFILAVNHEGLWIIDQHVAHERVLFEKVLRQRAAERVETQRLLMPLIVELTPGQQAIFAEISDELRRNGFEVEPFGSRTIAVKTSPAGVEASEVERMLHELLDQFEREEQALNMEVIRARIAASIACHAAVKVNMPLEQNKMEWLLKELAKTECPMSCPHGRPVVLRYSMKDIQRAFKRI